METEFEKVRGGGAIIPPAPPFIEIDTFIFEVEFILPGSNGSHILLPGAPFESVRLRMEQPVLLLAPDGREILTHIDGFPSVRTNRSGYFQISVPHTIDKVEIPIGTQVWAVKG